MKLFCVQNWVAPEKKEEELEGSKHLERSEEKLGMGENDVGVEANAAIEELVGFIKGRRSLSKQVFDFF